MPKMETLIKENIGRWKHGYITNKPKESCMFYIFTTLKTRYNLEGGYKPIFDKMNG